MDENQNKATLGLQPKFSPANHFDGMDNLELPKQIVKGLLDLIEREKRKQSASHVLPKAFPKKNS